MRDHHPVGLLAGTDVPDITVNGFQRVGFTEYLVIMTGDGWEPFPHAAVHTYANLEPGGSRVDRRAKRT